jgi:adenosylcobinamide amidohydrolase
VVTTSPASSSTAIPIQLFIIDTSSSNQILATLNLDAVLLNGSSQSSAQLTSALQTITNKNASDADKSTATKMLTSAGLSTDAINSLAKNGKKVDWAGTVGTILGTLGKSAVSAYLGIPATTPAAAAPATSQ